MRHNPTQLDTFGHIWTHLGTGPANDSSFKSKKHPKTQRKSAQANKQIPPPLFPKKLSEF